MKHPWTASLWHFAATHARLVSVLGFSCLFAYLLAFLFEGQVLYALLHSHNVKAQTAIFSIMAAHFGGLFCCGFFVSTARGARWVLQGSMALCLVLTLPVFFVPPALWLFALIVGGFVSGCMVASWGYFLKAFTPSSERFKSCADVLIGSNVLMIGANMLALKVSPLAALVCIMGCALVGMLLIAFLPNSASPLPANAPENPQTVTALHMASHRPLYLLFAFVTIISVNSGLMYQVVNPAFEQLVDLATWYWAVPYVIALMIIRTLPAKTNRSHLLYIGIIMMIAAFIGFMLLGRDRGAYLAVNTLLLGACGIFDLFGWSILGEMLDYTDKPAKIFGIGLSANVFGVLCGGVLGTGCAVTGLSAAELAVIALVVACITLALLPLLNQQLVILLKNHMYLSPYDHMTDQQQRTLLRQSTALEPLTERERDVAQSVLLGKSNKDIAVALNISEHTVKSHLRNIFFKYEVKSRAQLISTLLQGDFSPEK